MKTTYSLIQLGVLGLVVAMASACSSSSTTSPKSDAEVSDTGSSTHDGGVTDSSKSDGSSKKDAAEDAAPFLLDAAMAGMGVSSACEACIETNCLPKAQGCFQTAGCKAIEECGLSCIAKGGAAGTCVPGCIQAANPDGSTSSPAQQASIALSYCLSGSCTSDCN
jgi:hypothetical protein